MNVFFSTDLDGDMLLLSPEESHHAVRVLRLREGQNVVVTDGKGKWCKGLLAEANAKACLVNVSNREQQTPRPFHLHMAVAPTKNIDRFEWFLEKATECGIDEITPIFSENSERNVIKAERLEKLLASAMKQSMRAWLPVLNPAIRLKDFLNKQKGGIKMVAHCGPEPRNTLNEIYIAGKKATVLIGPEGDFSKTEVEIAFSAGFLPITIGDYRLRTETAALALCIELNFLNNLL
ncbi:MAG: 16S rRNA (uracil(1498)-N(3))-methyltransferase [Bacteroidales bacterium]|jgi:16S rRNA (uracil1498-N3)-methyltransferase|nr:16S rRNA (uracil(1498)-N(3))-methyltransferase [Bacteroidales bacterium]NLM91845.1 16S rRNA (uracil(1498)-N(3))-methyltransferase [Bacteroidales bacterium]